LFAVNLHHPAPFRSVHTAESLIKMVVGALRQILRVRTLPTGCSMLITDVKFNNCGGGWWPGLSGISNNVSIYKNNVSTQQDLPNAEGEGVNCHDCQLSSARTNLPIEIRKDGCIGEAYLSSQSVWDSGNGPDITVDVTLQGPAAEKQYYTKKGQIVVWSSEWSKWERPDWMRVKYMLEGGSWREISSKVPGGGQPQDMDFVVGFNSQNKQLGINATSDGGALNDLKNSAEQGSFQDRNGAGGWSTINV
jgi:hypothetical protein